MQIAIFDYYDGSVNIYPVPKDIEALVNDPDEDFDLNEWVEGLPVYHNQCYWMSPMNGEQDIKVNYYSEKDLYN